MEPTAEQRERWRRVADAATATLKHALDAGYLDNGRVPRDAVFKPMAEHTDFRAICNEMAVRKAFPLGGPVASPTAVLARRLVAMNDWNGAEAHYTQAVTRNASDTNLRRERAAFLARRGQWRQAIADYDVLLQRLPGSADAWLERGRCHAMLKEWDQTAADFLTALDRLPKDNAFISGGSRACKELAQWQPALDKALQRRPGNSRLLIGKARFHLLRGQWRDAAPAFAEAKLTRCRAQPNPEVAYVIARACRRRPMGRLIRPRSFAGRSTPLRNFRSAGGCMRSGWPSTAQANSNRPCKRCNGP